MVNFIVKRYLHLRDRRLERAWNYPRTFQMDWLQNILFKGAGSTYAQSLGLEETMSYEDFRDRTPIIEYEDIAEQIDRMMRGEENVLWPGVINWYAKSSGTTNAKSKFIPVSKDNLREGHIESAWDTMTLVYNKIPDAKMFAEKSLLVGGALSHFESRPETKYGDISAILIDQMPPVGRPFYTPDFETALIPNWDEKLERIAQITSRENVVMIGGVPTWNIVLFRRILEITRKSNLKEVWPDLQVYVHGGVSFEPYRAIFKELIPDPNFVYQEIYNASEGFFAVQDRKNELGMALLMDNGIFFEFMPVEEYGKERPHAIPVWEVETGKNYAIVVTNNSGLWRYIPGDTVEFITTYPHRIKITGRLKHFINAFGEEVVVSNTDEALARTCESLNATTHEYTVAPIYFEKEGHGGHEWYIEFDHEPSCMEEFTQLLDQNLQSINSDYEAKRYQDMAVLAPKIRVVPSGTFEGWLRETRTLGAQVKVPRLSNQRQIIESIDAYLKK